MKILKRLKGQIYNDGYNEGFRKGLTEGRQQGFAAAQLQKILGYENEITALKSALDSMIEEKREGLRKLKIKEYECALGEVLRGLKDVVAGDYQEHEDCFECAGSIDCNECQMDCIEDNLKTLIYKIEGILKEGR